MYSAKFSGTLGRSLAALIATLTLALTACDGSNKSASNTDAADSSTAAASSSTQASHEAIASVSAHGASANGSMIPSVSQLVDSAGNQWTLSDGVIALNGRAQSVTQGVIVVLYYDDVIYQENLHCQWWSWTNDTWVATAQPAASAIPACSSASGSSAGSSSTTSASSAAAASTSGSLIPQVSKLVDSAGNVWTVSDGVISINGVAQTVTRGVIALLYYNGVIYQENLHCAWWSYVNGAWVASTRPAFSGIPGCSTSLGTTATPVTPPAAVVPTAAVVPAAPTASANGSMIPAVSQLVDSAGNVWTVSGGVISINGSTQSVTQGVIVLLYSNGVIYQENVHCAWWSYSNGTWVSSARPAASGLPACSDSASSSSASASSSSSTSSTVSSKSMTSSTAAPAPAAAVGYDLNTFNSVSYSATSGPWYAFSFYGSTVPNNAGATAQNADGSLSVPGTNWYNAGANIATAFVSHSGDGWTGMAFGGGAYFEAVIAFDNQNDQNFPNGGPAFWALDIEHTSQGPYQVSWPGTSNDSSGNPYDDFFEVDFMEYDFTGGYQFGIGNWYGYPPTKSTSNPTNQFGHNVVGSLLVPAGTDFSQPHRYGTLWVPATGSGQNTTTQGYLQNYFDGVPMGPKYTWDYHDPNAPGYPAPAPVVGSTAMSGMDWRHMFLILGTETQHPMTVYSVNVWQATAENNLTH